MVHEYVECKCGHQFFTEKEKPQCHKCGQRFPAFRRVHSMVSVEKERIIKQLQDKLSNYEIVIKKLIQKMEKENTENLDELKRLMDD